MTTGRETADRQDAQGERELALLLAASALNRESDEALERANRDRLPLRQTIDLLLPILARHTGADACWLRTWDEDLELRDFHWTRDGGALGLDPDEVYASCVQRMPYHEVGEGVSVVGQHLDVAGDTFGAAALRFDAAADGTSSNAGADVERARRLLDVWCEELDNFLAAIARARRKHLVTQALSKALRHPLLEHGIAEAVAVLKAEVPFDDLLLVYHHDEDHQGVSLNYRVIRDGKVLFDSLKATGQRVSPEVRARLLNMLDGQDSGVPAHFGISRYREEILINGLHPTRVVGRLVIGRRGAELNTWDRDLLESFADYVRQRIVDYNREWKRLSLCFPHDVVSRMLGEVDYVERYLKPREKDVAILYTDISGFTRLSEQVLGEPALMGELIDTWSARVVDIIWQTGGAFDKMVGDCIIGLWGPPFFDWDPAETCRRTADAALRICAYTKELKGELASLKEVDFPLGVATGLNYCPLFVGQFGPNEDFTGFSSGMNNTARLQGVAGRDDILCMDRFAATLGEPDRFGEEQEASVKNVARPIKYSALLK